MPAIVEFPQVVLEALPDFADLFSCEPQRRHFDEYLTGLLVARKKNVSAINREFANTTDQSCLNKFINDVTWDEKALNERRLEVLQRDAATRYSDQGVISRFSISILPFRSLPGKIRAVGSRSGISMLSEPCLMRISDR